MTRQAPVATPGGAGPGQWPWPYLLIAHRGVPLRAPENSLDGFMQAVSLGASMIETDVRASADGVLVLAHDDAILGARSARLAISGVRYAALCNRGGRSLALLSAALALRHHGAPLAFNLDIKAAGMARLLIDALRETGRRDGVLLTGHEPATFAAVRADEPWVQAALTCAAPRRSLPTRLRARRAPPQGGLLGRRLVAVARLAGVEALTLEHPLATLHTVAICHDAGLRVLVWTVDDPARMRALEAAGVDGITTNRIDLLAQITTRRSSQPVVR